jgi:hypothetical protein
MKANTAAVNMESEIREEKDITKVKTK